MSEVLPLRPDVWQQCIAPLLRCTDMCKLMRLSKAWFFFWISDLAWSHQRQRMCTQFPDLVRFFDAFALETRKEVVERSRRSNSNKKRKTAWIMPRAGTWFVFKRWLARCTNMSEFKLILRERSPLMDCLAVSVVRAHVPNAQRAIQRWDIKHHAPSSKVMHYIQLWTATGRLTFRVYNGRKLLSCKFKQHNPPGPEVKCGALYSPHMEYGMGDPNTFRPWRQTLLQYPVFTNWTERFVELMEVIKE